MTLTYKDEERVREIIREEIQAETRLLPTKDEFFSSMSELMGEIKALRQEHAIVQGHKDQLEDHESRLETLETKLDLSV